MDFETSLKSLASLIIAEAVKSETPFEQRVDALKAGTTLYGLLLKHKELDKPEVKAGPTFMDFSEAVADPAEAGRAPNETQRDTMERPNGGTQAAVRAGARRGPRRPVTAASE